jgi:predicted nucleic acid-binding protein
LSGNSSSPKKVYLDTVVLANWIFPPQPDARLSVRARKCLDLLELYRSGRLNVVFQSSEWAYMELAQAILDKLAWEELGDEGFGVRDFYNVREELKLSTTTRETTLGLVSAFEGFLKNLPVEMLPVRFEFLLVHDMVYRYGIDTGDAVHLLTASGKSDYLATVDSRFVKLKVAEVKVLDVGTLLSLNEIKKSTQT